MAAHSSILAWRIPWAEELVGYSPWGRKESDMTEHTCTHSNDREWNKEIQPQSTHIWQMMNSKAPRTMISTLGSIIILYTK